MKNVLGSFYIKPLVIYLSISLMAISTAAGPAEAMFVPAAPFQESAAYPQTPIGRSADLVKVQAVLESKIIRQRLKDYVTTFRTSWTEIIVTTSWTRNSETMYPAMP